MEATPNAWRATAATKQTYAKTMAQRDANGGVRGPACVEKASNDAAERNAVQLRWNKAEEFME